MTKKSMANSIMPNWSRNLVTAGRKSGKSQMLKSYPAILMRFLRSVLRIRSTLSVPNSQRQNFSCWLYSCGKKGRRKTSGRGLSSSWMSRWI